MTNHNHSLFCCLPFLGGHSGVESSILEKESCSIVHVCSKMKEKAQCIFIGRQNTSTIGSLTHFFLMLHILCSDFFHRFFCPICALQVVQAAFIVVTYLEVACNMRKKIRKKRAFSEKKIDEACVRYLFWNKLCNKSRSS